MPETLRPRGVTPPKGGRAGRLAAMPRTPDGLVIFWVRCPSCGDVTTSVPRNGDAPDDRCLACKTGVPMPKEDKYRLPPGTVIPPGSDYPDWVLPR